VRSTLALEIGDAESLARVGAEVAVAGFFRDQRPLRGGAGLADWRLCGFFSDLVLAARVEGEIGDAVLTTTHGRLRAPRLLLLGLGVRARFGADAHGAAVASAVERLVDLGASSAALDLPGPTGETSLDAIASSIVEGACAALDPRSARFLLRVVAPSGSAGRLRTALDQATASRPRGATSVRLVRSASAATPTSPAASVLRAPHP
jgi:hypothetical protein